MKILALDMHVHVFLHYTSSVGDSWSMVFFPDVFDLVGWLSFDH